MNESTLVPREEMSDLDWLARNVHLWPTSTPHIVPAGDSVFEFGATFFENHVCLYHREFADSKVIHKHQWLARRAELQNKPSWGAVPSNANWLAQDAAGSWLWHSSEPECRNGGWIGSTTRGYAAKGCVIGDWRDTLEKRPDMYKNKEEIDTSSECVHKTEESVHISELEMLARVSHLISDKRHRNQFDPFVSVEDAKITILQGDGDIKHFGGFIGRNLPFEEDAATAKQPAPKGSGSPILGMVLADLTNRALEGKEKYGEPLLAHNGRNPLWDAYQEALDLAMYLRQAIEEQKK